MYFLVGDSSESSARVAFVPPLYTPSSSSINFPTPRRPDRGRQHPAPPLRPSLGLPPSATTTTTNPSTSHRNRTPQTADLKPQASGPSQPDPLECGCVWAIQAGSARVPRAHAHLNPRAALPCHACALRCVACTAESDGPKAGTAVVTVGAFRRRHLTRRRRRRRGCLRWPGLGGRAAGACVWPAYVPACVPVCLHACVPGRANFFSFLR
jgi:hypothetical protein